MNNNVDVKSNTGYGITGFVLSLLGIVILISSIFILKLLLSIIGVIIGIIGLIFCIIQLRKGKTKLAISGLIINIIIIILFTLNIVSFFLLKSIVSSFMESGTKDVDKVANELMKNISN